MKGIQKDIAELKLELKELQEEKERKKNVTTKVISREFSV